MPTEIPAGTDLYYDWCNPMMIALVLGMAILGIGIFFSQAEPGRPGRARERRKGARSPIQPELSPAACTVDQDPVFGTERRTSVRRKGKTVKVFVCTDGAREDL